MWFNLLLFLFAIRQAKLKLCNNLNWASLAQGQVCLLYNICEVAIYIQYTEDTLAYCYCDMVQWNPKKEYI